MRLCDAVWFSIVNICLPSLYAQNQILSGFITSSVERKNEFVVEIKLVSPDTLPTNTTLELVSQSFTLLKSFTPKKISQSLLDTSKLWLTCYKTSFNLSAIPFLGNVPYYLGFRLSRAGLADFFLEAKILTSPAVGSYQPLSIKPLSLIKSLHTTEPGGIEVDASNSDSVTFELVRPMDDFGKPSAGYLFPDDRSRCSFCSFKINQLTGIFELSGQFRPGSYEVYIKINRWIKSGGSLPIPAGYSIIKATYSVR